jgi:tripartite-type tricarboxylate transporter receptor subunit TctC
MIVPFPPGGGTDIVARTIAQKATDALGQSVIVDNRAGGGGTIGAETVVRANPDGYTLAMVSASYATNPALYKLPVRPGEGHPADRHDRPERMGPRIESRSFPSRASTELVAHNKANPGKLNYASTGTGGATHFTYRALRADDRREDDSHPVQRHRAGVE